MKAHFSILMLLVLWGGLTALMNRFCQIRNVFFTTAGGKWCRKSLWHPQEDDSHYWEDAETSVVTAASGSAHGGGGRRPMRTGALGGRGLEQDKAGAFPLSLHGTHTGWRDKNCAHFLQEMVLLLFSCSVMPNSLRPHGLQHARLPCSSPTPGVYSNPCPSSRWCHPTMSAINNSLHASSLALWMLHHFVADLLSISCCFNEVRQLAVTYSATKEIKQGFREQASCWPCFH